MTFSSLSPPSVYGPHIVGPLRLRILGTERHGQIVEVKGNRCTVGAAPNCTLRLRAAGVRPIHCLILRGPDGATIRSLSHDTLLNDHPFREQSLRINDRLRVGPIEFEVLGDPAAVDVQPTKDKTSAASPPYTDRDLLLWTQTEAMRPGELMSRIESILEQQIESYQPRPTNGESSVARPNVTTHTVPAPAAPQPTAAEPDASAANLERLESDLQRLEVVRQQLEFDRQQLESDRQTLEATRQCLESERQNFESNRQVIESDRQCLESERQRLEMERQRYESSQSEESEQSRASQQRLEERIAQWEEMHRQAQLDLTRLHVELDRQRVELTGVADGLREDVKRLTSEVRVERENLETARRFWTSDRESLELEVRKNGDRCEEFERLLAARTDEFDQQRYRWNEERDTLQSALETLRVQRHELEQDALGLEAESMRLTSLVQELESRLSRPAPSPPVPEVEIVLNEEPTLLSSQSAPARGNPAQHRSELLWLAQQWTTADGEPVAENNSFEAQEPRSESFVPPMDPPPVDDVVPAEVDVVPSDLPTAPLYSDEAPPATELEFARPEPLLPAAIHTPKEPEPDDGGFEPMASDGNDVFHRLGRARASGARTHRCRLHSIPHPTIRSTVTKLPSTASARTFDRERWSPSWMVVRARHRGMTSRSPPSKSRPPLQNHSQRVGPMSTCWRKIRNPDRSPPVLESPSLRIQAEPLLENDRLGEDDSIESYMRRLLERVRGSGPAPTPSPKIEAPPADRGPISEIALPTPTPVETPDPRQTLSKDEYLPRSQAPELNSKLATMREIANTSRRTSLIDHAHRTWTDKSKAKLIGTLVCAAAAIASFCYLDQYSTIMLPVFVISLSTVLLLLLQAMSFRRRLFSSLALDRTPEPTEEVVETTSGVSATTAEEGEGRG